jgi:DNA-binding CsgD family transcriptional regulator
MATGVGTQVAADGALGQIRRSCAEATSAHDLFERVAADVHEVVPHDGAVWFGTDPATLLITSPVRVEAQDSSSCDAFWHHEFHVQDTAQFVDLARSPEPAAALHLSLDGDVGRSARYRRLLRPQGYEDELRCALRTGDSTWGLVGLMREKGRRTFEPADVALMTKASPIIAAALRDRIRAHCSWLGVARAPGVIVFDAHSRVVSANHDALHWLRQLLGIDDVPEPDPTRPAVETVGELLSSWPLERRISPIWALLARARAVADGIDSRAARLRLRDGRGRWMLLHGSALASTGDGLPTVAVVIEPAQSSEIAPIIIEAYSLTPRERDVVGALARGDTTSEIAARLFLSQHTVRDHIKTVFDKVGVSSRAELVAKLFAEHYNAPAHADMVHD